MNVEEIKYVLNFGANIDAVVAQWGQAMLAANTSPMYSTTGIAYSQAQNAVGFVVKAHGVTLLPSYEQVKVGAGTFPDILARVWICLPDADCQPGVQLFSALINDQGQYSLDGSRHFLYGIVPAVVDQGRFRLSMTIGQKLQETLKVV